MGKQKWCMGQQATWCPGFRLGLIRRYNSRKIKGEENYGVWYGGRKEGPSADLVLTSRVVALTNLISWSVDTYPLTSNFTRRGISFGYGLACLRSFLRCFSESCICGVSRSRRRSFSCLFSPFLIYGVCEFGSKS